MALPTTMKALWYNAVGNFEIKHVPVPKIGDYDVLLKSKRGTHLVVVVANRWASGEPISSSRVW